MRGKKEGLINWVTKWMLLYDIQRYFVCLAKNDIFGFQIVNEHRVSWIVIEALSYYLNVELERLY